MLKNHRFRFYFLLEMGIQNNRFIGMIIENTSVFNWFSDSTTQADLVKSVLTSLTKKQYLLQK